MAYKEQLWPNTEIIILFKFNCELYLYGKSRSIIHPGKGSGTSDNNRVLVMAQGEA